MANPIPIPEGNPIPQTIANLDKAMKLAAEREEYLSAIDMQNIKKSLEFFGEPLFTVKDIETLQSKVHKLTGNGEVMMLFNELLGVQTA